MVNTLPRRKVLRRALELISAVAVVDVLGRSATAAETCVEPGSESLRASLNYTPVSPKPAEKCANCGFFTPEDPKAACGPCAIMSGPVHAAARCDSWSARS